MVSIVGIEPTTFWLSVRRSTNWAKSIFCFRWVFLKDEVHRLFLATFWVVYKTSPSYFCQLRLLVLLTFVFTFGFPNITKDIRDQLLPVLANLPNWSTYLLSDFHPKSRLSTPTPQLLQSFLLSERIKAPLYLKISCFRMECQNTT